MSGKRGQKKGNKEEAVELTKVEASSLRRRILDFIASGEKELVLADLPKHYRKFLHQFAANKGLKSQSTGPDHNRVLRITQITQIKRDFALSAQKLTLKPASRDVLLDFMSNGQSNGEQQQRQERNLIQQNQARSEAFLLALGPRLVPPRANRISNELFRDKQELPIYRYQEDILQVLKQHSVFIVSGETGSGKTTQVPQYILNEATRKNRACRILVSQPRRVAAVSVAHRVAEERGEPIGHAVGYQIRMESCIRKTTNLIYTTSGCLLRSIMGDMQDVFRKTTHLIIDEIHERDKYTDFTLITIKEQLKHNRNFKVILMSATMDIKLLSEYFDNCPVFCVPGQGYDVKIYHLEDILFHAGYRTALMERYLRSMNGMQQLLPPIGLGLNSDLEARTAERLADEYLQETLDSLLDQCCEPGRSQEEICELFDQIQYYIESEGMPVDAGHSETGFTLLMAACKFNCPKYVQLLVERQAHVNMRDKQGYSAHDYAMINDDRVCSHILESFALLLQQQSLSQEDVEKQRLLTAYQKQASDEYDVDHDLILSLLEGLYRSSHPGAIMVFLPGYTDIIQQRTLIDSTLPADTYRICILHGQMDSQQQFEALRIHHVRKIILSTNIGQTSITIPDLAFIIDSGKVKMNSYDSLTESSQLQSVWISQADASQRAGRAGRTQNGVCYRLYSSAKYRCMSKFSFPEFMRIPLTEICLFAKTLDSRCDVQTYLSRSLSPPASISVLNAIKKLQILQVFNDDESVTELGRHLVQIPLEVQLGKCLLYSVFLKCFDPVATIVAFHSIKDPFILPSDRSAQGHASFMRKGFAGSSFSDQMGILTLYKEYNVMRSNKKRQRDFCNKYFLSQPAMEMFCAVRRQIADLVAQKYRLGVQCTMYNDDWNLVRYCLVTGFYPNVATLDRKKGMLMCGAEKNLIFQRNSALTPPGAKALKDYIDQLPNDWIVFYEKSRDRQRSFINMNTLVSPIMIALQCGRYCTVVEEDEANPLAIVDGNADPTPDKSITKPLQALSLNDDRNVIMLLDNWIKFETPAADAERLIFVRTMVQAKFNQFLSHGYSAQTATAAQCLQKLLRTLDVANKMPQVDGKNANYIHNTHSISSYMKQH